MMHENACEVTVAVARSLCESTRLLLSELPSSEAADLVPLKDLIAWENRAEADVCAIHARVTCNRVANEDIIERSQQTAATARAKDPHYFRRFKRLDQRLRSADI